MLTLKMQVACVKIREIAERKRQIWKVRQVRNGGPVAEACAFGTP
jgi:hypothetical protein